MSNLIGVIGESGTGKSTSIGSLDPKETVIINVADKPLPIKGFKKIYNGQITKGGNLVTSSDAKTIIKALNIISEDRKEIKNIIIDDSQYIMGFEFMDKANDKGFDKFNSIAKNFFDVINTSRKLREDLNIVILGHVEVTGEQYEPIKRFKTIGKMLDSKITIEGLFTVMLMTKIVKTPEGLEYYFITQNEGDSVCKSPKGMFENLYIPNDLQMVIDKVNEYYN